MNPLSKSHSQNNFVRNKNQFHGPPLEEDFNFVQNLTYDNTQIKRNRNNLHFNGPFPKNNFNQPSKNFKPNKQEFNFPNHVKNTFPMREQGNDILNKQFNQFRNSNHQQSNNFLSKNNYNNSSFNNGTCGFEKYQSDIQANMGYQNQNQIYMNHQSSQQQEYSQ